VILWLDRYERQPPNLLHRVLLGFLFTAIAGPGGIFGNSPNLKVDVNLVTLNFSVHDNPGAPWAMCTKKTLRLEDEGAGVSFSTLSQPRFL
jgi:hypothetical protein